MLRPDGAGLGVGPASLVTRATRSDVDWVLSGSKIFITLGSWAGLALVFARTGEEGARGLSCFLVPTGSPGFSATRIKGKLGLRAQDTAELTLDGVRVPGSSMLGAEGDGFKVAMSALTTAGSRSRQAASGSRRAVSTRASATRPSGSSSASRSPPTSSCRS